MRNIKTAFGTIIYQEAWDFSFDFIESINRQQGIFDFLVINDNCTKEQMDEIKHICKKNIILKNIEEKLTPGELRIALISYAKELGYELLILGDFDDIFFDNRVIKYQIEYSSEFTFFYNYIYDFGDCNMMSEMPIKTENILDILDYNYLGLSNTALSLRRISNDFLESLQGNITQVFDWYFFSRLLLGGMKGKLVKGTGTNYRIHNNNIAGITNNKVNTDNIKREIKVKIEHYTLLIKYDVMFSKKVDIYKRIESYLENAIEISDISSDNNFWWGILNDTNIIKIINE